MPIGYSAQLQKDSRQGQKFKIKQPVVSVLEEYRVYNSENKQILHGRRSSNNLIYIGLIFSMLFTLFIPGFWLLRWATDEGYHFSVALLIAWLPLVALAIFFLSRRNIKIYTDEYETELLFTILQDQYYPCFKPTYTLLDKNKSPLARFRHSALIGMVREQIACEDMSGKTIFTAKEDHLALAAARRTTDIGTFIPMNFHFLGPDQKEEWGIFERDFGVDDHYSLNVYEEWKGGDVILAIVMGILLDTALGR